ncbi:hypothetical protein [Roseivirga thermotolerans]|uniref:hypothetical protein n=1 Tax=Roseivirga thermotolerans TaxID=1758176 RepID=UPI00273EDCD9|nr:hypothetical protein [Roseivirga thermotolerans]
MTKSIQFMVFAIMVVVSQQMFAQTSDKTLLKTEQLAVRLGLNAEQKAELDKELKAAQEARKQRMEQFRTMREELRRDAFVERQEQRERMKALLTPEQLAKLEELKGRRGEAIQRMQREDRGRHFDGPRQPMRFKRHMLKRRMELRKSVRKDGGR